MSKRGNPAKNNYSKRETNRVPPFSIAGAQFMPDVSSTWQNPAIFDFSSAISR